MANEENKPEPTTEQKIQRVVSNAADVLVLVQAALVVKKFAVAGLNAFKNR